MSDCDVRLTELTETCRAQERRTRNSQVEFLFRKPEETFLCNDTHPRPISERGLDHTPRPWPVTSPRTEWCSDLSGHGGVERTDTLASAVPDDDITLLPHWIISYKISKIRLTCFLTLFIVVVLSLHHVCGKITQWKFITNVFEAPFCPLAQ